MASRKRHSSTSNDPFGQFREFTTSMSIDEGIVDGLDLHSEPLDPFLVDWHGLLAGSHMIFPTNFVALQIDPIVTPTLTVAALISVTATNARIMRDMDAAPTPKEILKQLRELHAALRRVGVLAQGSTGDEQIKSPPNWHTLPNWEAYDEADERPLPLQRRSRILHPILQDHIHLALQHGRDEIENDFERKLFDAHLEKQERMLLEFFDELPEVLDWIQKATKSEEAHASAQKRERKKGAPSNRAADWAMVRLMWIWRDVLGREINIYVRRISGQVELDEPEPNACVSFVQRVMERIDPQMLPVGAQNLERKLIALRARVPKEPLVAS